MIGGNFLKRKFLSVQLVKYSRLRDLKVFNFNEQREPEFIDVLSENYQADPQNQQDSPKRDFQKEVLEQYSNQPKKEVIETLYKEYLKALNDEQTSTAKDFLSKILILEPENGIIYTYRAQIYLMKKDYPSAKKDFIESLKHLKHPDPQIYFNLALIETDQKTKQEYYFKIVEILEKKPNQLLLKTYNNIAHMFLKNNDFKNGLENIQKVFQLSNQIPNYILNKEYYIRARLYQELGNFTESEQDYKTFISKNPKNRAGLLYYSKCLISLKKYKESIEFIDILIEEVNKLDININDKTAILQKKLTLSEYYFWKGICLMESDLIQEAKDSLEQSVKNNSKNLLSLKKLGLCYHLLGLFEDAVFTYSQAINVHMRDFETYILRSESYIGMKKYQEAIDDQEMSLHFLEEDAIHVKFNILVNLIELYQFVGNEQKVMELCDKVLKVDTENKEANISKGIILFKKKEYHEAIKYLEKVKTEEERIWFMKGISHYKIGEFQKSVDAFKECVKINPSKTNLHSLATAEWKNKNIISSIKHFLNY